MDERPLILTARFDSALFNTLNSLRKQHFPPARNFLSAHLTLFHALPGLEIGRIRRSLQLVASKDPMECILPSLRFTGRGVQAVVRCPPLQRIRESLSREWRGWLSPQDQQLFQPHVTIQNKCDPIVARNLFEELNSSWTPLTGKILGLDLWHYAGGPWESAGMF